MVRLKPLDEVVSYDPTTGEPIAAVRLRLRGVRAGRGECAEFSTMLVTAPAW